MPQSNVPRTKTIKARSEKGSVTALRMLRRAQQFNLTPRAVTAVRRLGVSFGRWYYAIWHGAHRMNVLENPVYTPKIVNVVVAVDDKFPDRLPEVADRLRSAGMTVETLLEVIGTIWARSRNQRSVRYWSSGG